MDEAEVQRLTARAVAGDRAALAALLEGHLPELEAFVRARMDRRWKNRESSVDLAQSVCRDLLQHADRFRHADPDAFRRWLFATASRKLHDRRDYHHAARRDVGLESPPSEGVDSPDTFSRPSPTPSQTASAHEELARIESALERLPEDYREVISLARIAGLSHRSIGEIMQRNEGAVRMLLHRALGRLTEELESS